MSTAAPRPLALVTGGVRRLGAGIAARLYDAGYDLALVSHGDHEPDPVLNAALASGAAQIIHHDLSDPAGADALFAAVATQCGRAPSLLINNAARFGQDRWPEMSAETLEAHFRLNLFSPLLLARALAAAVGERGGAVVNITDQRVQNPHGDQLSYTLSKQALAAATRSMAAALAPHLRVNAVAPGLTIATADYDDAILARNRDAMPLHRLPSVDEVADAVLYLAQAKSTTGQTIFVDGGAHLTAFDRDFMHL